LQEEAIEETIELSYPQFDFLTSTKKHTGFVAGFGSGKSFIGTLKSLNKIINNGIPKTAYYLPTYGDIRDIAFDTFPTVADLLGYEYKLNKTDKEFILYDNGKVIGKTLFRNMSEPETIVGYQVGYTLIDETDILKEPTMDKAFKKILGRNRLVVEVEEDDILHEYESSGNAPEGTYWHKKKKILCYVNGIDVAGTPEGFKWFYKRFVKRFRENTDILIKASTYSNMDNLPEDFIDTLRDEYTPELFEAYVNGEFVNLTSGTVYKYFDRKRHHTDREVEPNDILHIGQDFNINGCVSTIHVIDKGIPKRVAEASSYDTRGIVATLKTRYPNHKILIYPDASGNSSKTNASETDIELLKKAGFMVIVPKKNGYVKDRVNATNTLFSHDKYLINTNTCPESTNALEQQSYDKNGAPEKFNGGGTLDDYNDSGGYFIVRKFQISSRCHVSVQTN